MNYYKNFYQVKFTQRIQLIVINQPKPKLYNRRYILYNTPIILPHIYQQQLKQSIQYKARSIQTMSTCEIYFLDCMGYWDMGSQILSLFILVIVLAKTLVNINKLFLMSKITHDTQLANSHNRKLIINILSLIYEISLLVTVAFSLLIFVIFMNQMTDVSQMKINIWYKWCEIIFINLLNCVNLTVGLLYWKAVRLYYKLSQQHQPAIYSKYVKLIFALIYVFNFSIVIISLIMLLDNDEQPVIQSQKMKIVFSVNSFGVSCSTLVCLVSRVLYQRKILNSMTVNKLALRKETVYSVLIAFSGICRLTCMGINLAGIDFSIKMRNFNHNCIDKDPYNAIVMFFTTILVNVVPPIIFSIIFSPTRETHKTYRQISQYLCKKDESVIYV